MIGQDVFTIARAGLRANVGPDPRARHSGICLIPVARAETLPWAPSKRPRDAGLRGARTHAQAAALLQQLPHLKQVRAGPGRATVPVAAID